MSLGRDMLAPAEEERATGCASFDDAAAAAATASSGVDSGEDDGDSTDPRSESGDDSSRSDTVGSTDRGVRNSEIEVVRVLESRESSPGTISRFWRVAGGRVERACRTRVPAPANCCSASQAQRRGSNPSKYEGKSHRPRFTRFDGAIEDYHLRARLISKAKFAERQCRNCGGCPASRS